MRHPRVRADVAQETTVSAPSATGPVAYVTVLPHGPIHVITESALAIWSAVDGRPLDEVVAAVATAHELTEDEVRDDVLQYLDELTRAGLIVG